MLAISRRRLIISILLCFSLAGVAARTSPFAAILPFGRGNDEEDKKRSSQGKNEPNKLLQDPRKRPPPPPPPPLPRGASEVSQAQSSKSLGSTYVRTSDPSASNDGFHPPNPGWFGSPSSWNPYEHSQWHPPNVQSLDLETFIARESALLDELENATTALAAYAQRDDLHMRQLDVLTERVMEAEAAAAAERNCMAEYRANCTELGKTVAILQDEIHEWARKCHNLTIQHQNDTEQLEGMKIELKDRNREVEELASMIESARLNDERERYLVERNTRKKKRGFFAWLFGWSSREEDEEDKLQEAQEFARSTLLRALQTERDSVHELETALSILQQNNSAISEMVHSRDMLIEELNNRVAVFEEDKLVLKAALKQLQKEMKEEGPKTQKVLDNLKHARAEVERLNSELTAIRAEHDAELSRLEELLAQKQASINSSESNMTMIGSYVDQLEERLATFALARRDIEVREQKCSVIEQKAIQLEEECKHLREQVHIYDTEHDDLKSLLADLVQERAELQRDHASLLKDKSSLVAETSMLRDTVSSLEIDVDSLGKYISVWTTRVKELEHTVENQASELRESAARETELARALTEKGIELEHVLHQKVHGLQSGMADLLDGAEMQHSFGGKSEQESENESKLPRKDAPPPPPPPPLVQSEEVIISGLYEDPSRDFDQSDFHHVSADTLERSSPLEDKIQEEDVSHHETNAYEDSDQGMEKLTSSLDFSTQESWIAQERCDGILSSDGVNDALVDLAEEGFENENEELSPDDALRTENEDSESDKSGVEVPNGSADASESDDLCFDSSIPSLKGNHQIEEDILLRTVFDNDSKGKGVTDLERNLTDATIVDSSRKVPFRAIRKAFARTTGIHGVLTPASKQNPK